MQDDIDYKLKLKHNDLLFLIGQDLAKNDASSRRAFPPNRTEIIEKARRYFSSKLPEIRRAICKPEIQEKISNSKNEATLVAAISDLIASIIIGVSPVTVAVLLITYGLDEICREKQDD